MHKMNRIETSLAELPVKEQLQSAVSEQLDKKRSKSVATKAARPKTPNASKLSTRSHRPRRATANSNALHRKKPKLKPAVSASSHQQLQQHSNTNTPTTDSSAVALHVRKEDRDLSTWSKMEIAEWLQLHWYAGDDDAHSNKLFTYISKIKREKKFDGKNLSAMSERDLKILAHRYLGLDKHDVDHARFLAHIRKLQQTYAQKSREKIRHHSQASAAAQTTHPKVPKARTIRRHKSSDLHAAARKHFRHGSSTPEAPAAHNHHKRRGAISSTRTEPKPKAAATKTQTRATQRPPRLQRQARKTSEHRKSRTFNALPKSLSVDISDDTIASTNGDDKNSTSHKLRRTKKQSQHKRHKSGHPLSSTSTGSKKKPRSPTPAPSSAPTPSTSLSSSKSSTHSKSSWPRPRLRHVKENKELSATSTSTVSSSRKPGKLVVTIVDEQSKKVSKLKQSHANVHSNGRRNNSHGNRSRSTSPSSVRMETPVSARVAVAAHSKHMFDNTSNPSCTARRPARPNHKQNLNVHTQQQQQQQSTTPKPRRNVARTKTRPKPMTPTPSMPSKPPKRLPSRRSISSFNGRTAITSGKSDHDALGVNANKKKARRRRPRGHHQTPQQSPVNMAHSTDYAVENESHGLVILTNGGDSDHQRPSHFVAAHAINKKLSLSQTSPAGSPAPALSFAALKQMINATHGGSYDGVTADELLQLISYGHCDEVDTDYDTDTNVYFSDLNEHISDTPSASPKTITARRLHSNNSNVSNVSISADHDQQPRPKRTQNKPKNKNKNRHRNKAHQFAYRELSDSDYDDDDDDDGSDDGHDDGTFFGQSFSSPNITSLSRDTSMPPAHSLKRGSNHGNNASDSSVYNRHHTTVIPSIFAIDDDADDDDASADRYAKIALSPIIAADSLTAQNRGLLLNMNRYSMTDESTDEEERASTPIRQALLATKRIIEYAVHNSPIMAPRSKAIPNFPDHELDGNGNVNEILPAPRLSASDTPLAMLDQ